MAAGAVGFLLTKVDSLLVEEGRLLIDVQKEVQEIKDELESIQAFIGDADAREEEDEEVKTWVKQVRQRLGFFFAEKHFDPTLRTVVLPNWYCFLKIS